MEEEQEEQQSVIAAEDESKMMKKKNKRSLKNKQQESDESAEEKIQIEEEEEENNKEKRKKKKKSKQVEEGDNEPRAIKMKIEMIPEDKEKIAPIVDYFPSGFDPSKSKDGVEVRTFTRNDKPNRIKVVVTPKVEGGGASNVNFVGYSHSGEAAASQPCTYALCVVDRDAQTIKIVPIAANKILRLEPVVGGLDLQPEELNGEVLTPAERVTKQRALQEKYGAKKATAKDRKITELNRKEDEETQKVIDEKVSEVEINTKALESTDGTPARNIPPHDSTADTPERAYPLEQIILEAEWKYLPDITEFVGETTIRVNSGFPLFVCNRLEKLRQIQDEDEKYKVAGIYSYITQLIRFKDQNKEHRIAPYFNNKFSGMFADSSSKFLPPEKKDYVMVLTLIAEGYQTDINDIGSDLKLGLAERRRYWEHVGGKLKKNVKTKKFDVCTLPLPLNFPQQKMRRQRRR